MIKFTGHPASELLGSNVVRADADQFDKFSCEITGERNSVTLEKGAKLSNLAVQFFGSESHISLGKLSTLRGKVSLGFGCTISVGRAVTVTASLELTAAEGTRITIGDDCMFGIGCRVLTHDFHPIFDLHTGGRINESKDIVVGNHVWVGDGATIRKGVKIGDGSVIGQGAVVLNDIPANSVAVGAPAKVVRSGIRWDRASLRREAEVLMAVSSDVGDQTERNSSKQVTVHDGSICNFIYAGQPFRFFIRDRSDEISRYILKGNFYEIEELQLISKYVSAGSTIVEIGSNIGNHAVFFEKIIGCKHNKIFEMNIEAHKIAEVNFLLNGIKYVDASAVGVALGNNSGRGTIKTMSGNLGGSTIVAAKDGLTRIAEGDEMIGDLKPNFIKIDVEGDELAVLEGLSATISAHRPDLFIEIDEANENLFANWLLLNKYKILDEYKRYRMNRNLFVRAAEL